MSEEQFVIETLSPQVTARRLDRMNSVLDARTAWITVAVEDIYQPHNASAVLRSCDAFGIQHVHIIENRNRWRPNPAVELGTAQWLTLHRYTDPGSRHEPAAAAGGWPPVTDQTERCIDELRAAGYRIVATSPHEATTTPAELDLTSAPVALLFGTEKEGLTPRAIELADERLAVPMVGFVESLNISVSAAVILAQLTSRVRTGTDVSWQIEAAERSRLLAAWLSGSVRNAAAILERSRARQGADRSM